MRFKRAVHRRAVVAVTVAMLVPLALTAAATRSGPCDGSVEIDGIRYDSTNDTASDPIVIPDRSGLTAEWRGETAVAITDHSGSVGVVIGPGTIEIADWSGSNGNEETEAAGSYSIDDGRDELPIDLVGLYEVTAEHAGTGGTCSGTVMILIEGNALTNPIGAGSLVGLIVSGAGLVMAGRRRSA